MGCKRVLALVMIMNILIIACARSYHKSQSPVLSIKKWSKSSSLACRMVWLASIISTIKVDRPEPNHPLHLFSCKDSIENRKTGYFLLVHTILFEPWWQSLPAVAYRLTSSLCLFGPVISWIFVSTQFDTIWDVAWAPMTFSTTAWRPF